MPSKPFFHSAAGPNLAVLLPNPNNAHTDHHENLLPISPNSYLSHLAALLHASLRPRLDHLADRLPISPLKPICCFKSRRPLISRQYPPQLPFILPPQLPELQCRLWPLTHVLHSLPLPYPRHNALLDLPFFPTCKEGGRRKHGSTQGLNEKKNTSKKQGEKPQECVCSRLSPPWLSRGGPGTPSMQSGFLRRQPNRSEDNTPKTSRQTP